MLWSWILAVVGLVGFVLAGRKIWWCWYINIAAQALWFAYALVTKQYGFIASSLVYAVVFAQNAYKWTKERNKKTIEEPVITPIYRNKTLERAYKIKNHRDYTPKHDGPHFFVDSQGVRYCACFCANCQAGGECTCGECGCAPVKPKIPPKGPSGISPSPDGSR